MKHFNKLTPAEDERLAILMEECAEAIQIIGKIQRHGYESTHPNGGPTNRELLQGELGHIRAALDLCLINNDLDEIQIQSSRRSKLTNIKPYLHHQG